MCIIVSRFNLLHNIPGIAILLEKISFPEKVKINSFPGWWHQHVMLGVEGVEMHVFYGDQCICCIKPQI